MNAYKENIGDLDELIDNATNWISKGGKQFYKFPEDANALSPRCQLCEKICYPAERVTYNTVPYHNECFRCAYCQNKISPANANPIGPCAFSCSTHFDKVRQRGRKPSVSTDEGKTEEELATQRKKQADEKNAKGEKRSSFSGGQVDLTNGIQWRSEGNKQIYKYPEDLTGPTKCVNPRCQKCSKTVYQAEKFTYEMIPYHKNCVHCLQCGKKIGAAEATPFGNDEFLCNVHYNNLVSSISVRPRNRSYSSSDTFEKSDNIEDGIRWLRSGKKQSYRFPEDVSKINPRCNLCEKTSYSAETVTYNRIPYHSFCFRCLRCGKKLSGGDANPFGDMNYLCNDHYQTIATTVGIDMPKSVGTKDVEKQSTFERDENYLDERMYTGYEWRMKKGKQTYKYPEDLNNNNYHRCNFCGKKAYPAEIMTYEMVPYHMDCFRCLKCHKKVAAGNATPFGEEVFLCDTHFAQYGQGVGLPPRENKQDKVDENVEETGATQQKRRRRKEE